MDETRNKNKSATWAGVVLLLILVIFLFILYKFGDNSAEVYNQQLEEKQDPKESLRQELVGEKNSDLWGKYIDKILEETNKEEKMSTQDLSLEYQKELESKVSVPTEVLFLQGNIVEDSFEERAKYLNQFEELFVNNVRRGAFSEAGMFASQAAATGTTLVLSDSDRASVLRQATDYELWSKDILKMDTPRGYQDKNLKMAQDLNQLAYILRKVVVEEDNEVYVLWIAKYLEKAFDILANRYVK